MIRVVTNSQGSGDWTTVQIGGRDEFEELHSGHRITPFDLVEILRRVGVQAQLVEVSDEEMEEGEF